MVTQAILDWFRDLFVGFVSWLSGLVDAVGGPGSAAFVGGAFTDASHFIALFCGTVAWAALLSAFGAYVIVFLASSVVAMFMRRGTSS